MSGGHDDQVLAEPTRGVVETISDGYGSVALEFSSRWRHALGGDQVQVEAVVRGTEYMSGVLGLDRNFFLDTRWQKAVTSGSTFQVQGMGWVFRRERMQDFNLNAWVVSGRYVLSPGGNTQLALGGRYHRVGFTNRLVLPDTTRTGGPGEVVVFPVGEQAETDHQTDALVTGAWSAWGVHAAMELSYRWGRSNEPLVEYQGPQATLRLGSRINGSDVVGYVSAASRDFRKNYVLEETPRKRRDRALQVGLFADRSLTPRLRVFLDASWQRQDSKIDAFTFDQAQIQLGLRVNVLHSRGSIGFLDRLGSVAVEEGPTVFTYQNADARSVSVVGDFNGWDPGKHRMQRTTDGIWSLRIRIPRGVWRYSLVVDGQWVTPPEAARYEPDGFGGQNAVLIVP